MTLPEAITIVRSACEKVLEADKKATKGPWTIAPKKTRDDGINIWSGENVVRFGFGQWHIAEVQGAAGDVDDDETESEANAELIALYRTLNPITARLLLALPDTSFVCWCSTFNATSPDYVCPTCLAFRAAAEELSR